MGNPTVEDQIEFFGRYVKLSKDDLEPFVNECSVWTLCDFKNFSKYCLRHYLRDHNLEDDKMNITIEQLTKYREQYMQLKYSADESPSYFL